MDFVRDYGETLPSLEAWYAVFDPFYRAQCAELGRPLTPDTPLLCERFHMLFVPTPVGTG